MAGTAPPMYSYHLVLLLRGIGEKVRQAVVDPGFLGPNAWIEAGRQTGLELLCRQSGDVHRSALAHSLGSAACGGIPIIVRLDPRLDVSPSEPAHHTRNSARHGAGGIGVLDIGLAGDPDKTSHIGASLHCTCRIGILNRPAVISTIKSNKSPCSIGISAGNRASREATGDRAHRITSNQPTNVSTTLRVFDGHRRPRKTAVNISTVYTSQTACQPFFPAYKAHRSCGGILKQVARRVAAYEGSDSKLCYLRLPASNAYPREAYMSDNSRLVDYVKQAKVIGDI